MSTWVRYEPKWEPGRREDDLWVTTFAMLMHAWERMERDKKKWK